MTGRRSTRHGQDAPRPCKSHPEGVGKHEDPGPPDSHRHEPQEAGCRSDAVALLDHRRARSPTKPGLSLKRLLQQPPGDGFPDDWLYLFVAIDRASKFAFVELHQKAGKMAATVFLRNLIAATPYRLHIVLTDNGIQFTNHDRHIYAFEHIFDRVCREHQIEHRLTKIRHPWTNGQVERMNRTIKDATVKRFHYDDHEQLRNHLANFIRAYNFGRRLKTLKGLTPYEFICKQWTIEPERFTLNPIHQLPGLNT